MTRPVLRRMARLLPDRRGATIVEFGLTALPLVLVLFGIVEIGLAVRTKSALQFATAQAARCLAVDKTTCPTADSARSYAVAQTMGLPVTVTAFTVSTVACGQQVVASVPFPIVAHKVIPGSLTLTAKSCYPI